MVLVSGRSCRLKAPKGFNMVQVGVQREPRNQVQKRNNQERAAGKTMKKSPLGRVARTIPVQRARQAACPLPVVDDRKFAARAPPLRSCRSCRGAFLRMQGRWCSAGSKRQSCDDGGKACYVVEIYWTGVVRASETLSIAEWKCLSAFRT